MIFTPRVLAWCFFCSFCICCLALGMSIRDGNHLYIAWNFMLVVINAIAGRHFYNEIKEHPHD